jgi:hypothetical protein
MGCGRLLALLFAVLVAVGVPVAAWAQDGEEVAAPANLEGCEGEAVALRPNGSIRDRAIGSSEHNSSADNPFHVGAKDTVQWAGTSAEGPGEFTWRIKVAGITVDEGRESGGNRTQWAGKKQVGDLLPFKITGVYHLEWELDGERHDCRGDLWIKLEGSPLWTTPWFLGAGFLLLALGGLWLARPSRRVRPAAERPVEEVEP